MTRTMRNTYPSQVAQLCGEQGVLLKQLCIGRALDGQLVGRPTVTGPHRPLARRARFTLLHEPLHHLTPHPAATTEHSTGQRHCMEHGVWCDTTEQAQTMRASLLRHQQH